MRIGHGFDVHAFAKEKGETVRLGGVDIPYEYALAGHSDADVVLHAVTDALAGAVALGDIGHFFPDNDERWKNADSRELLKHVTLEVRARGYCVKNIDITILAEAPKIAPYRDAMRDAIAEALGCTARRVSVKATTTEGLGFIGRKEGIAVHAVILVSRIDGMTD
jgi:2-C-methyl-D-erythritol 2,4-cyclodiphosphate synthase